MQDELGLIHRVDDEGLLRVTFDTRGSRVNLLRVALLEALGRLLEEVGSRTDVHGVLFTSARPRMFLAGMDVEEIAAATGSVAAADAARHGQSVFQKIAELRVPSLAMIGGPCLGGGTELALACTFRVAADDPEVKIGLPEVQLGIIPGFGGTQRLPARIGLAPALELILTGRTVGARRARAMGLVDLVVPSAYLERESLGLLRRAIAEGPETVAGSLRRPRRLAALLDGLAPYRRIVLSRARQRVATRLDPRAYPAPFRAIEAVEAAFTLPLGEGFDLEARIVGELLPHPTAQNLLWLFKSQTALKGDRAAEAAVPRKIRRLAVVGAGVMGGGIAHLAADREIPVRLKDVRYEAILTALRTARELWQTKVDRGQLTPRELERRMALIAPTLGESGLATVDLVIEAVVESLEIKQQVLAAAEQHIGERAVFASNTSSLPIGDIAARALRPERVVGLHFFNPVHRMPLVEVIAGRQSSPEALATVRALAVRLGKVPVIVRDGPGFLVNRILSFYINEALRLLDEGVRIEAADRAMTAFGMPVGPFALLDQVGLDTALHVGEVLAAALGRRAVGNTTALRGLVAAGRLGAKSGRGFYRYRGGKRLAPDGEVYGLAGSPAPRELPPETLEERMVLAMVNEAAICLEERVAREPRDIDVAMVMGTGFPPFRGGLLRHADATGIPIVADRLARLADAHGERFRPAVLLEEMVRGQRRFYGSS